MTFLSASYVLFAFVLAIGVQLFLIPDYRQSTPSADLTGRNVIVTGASFGIGEAIAREYAMRGASKIVLVSRSIGKLEKVKQTIFRQHLASQQATQIYPIAADLSSESACAALMKEAMDKDHLDGQLDFLVLNHITSSYFGTWLGDNAALEGGHSFLSEMFSVNAFSYMWLSTLGVPYLEKTDGQIVSISSLAAFVGTPKTAAYSSTKHAVLGFMDSLRIELKMKYKEHLQTRQDLEESGVKSKDIMHEGLVGITTVALGPFDTEGAKSVKVSFDPSIVTWGAPAEAALAVVGAATSKRAEIYHPHRIVYPMVMMRPFFPWLVDFCLELSLIQEVKPIKLSRLEARDVEKRTEEVMKGETGIKAGMGSAGEVPRMVEF